MYVIVCINNIYIHIHIYIYTYNDTCTYEIHMCDNICRIIYDMRYESNDMRYENNKYTHICTYSCVLMYAHIKLFIHHLRRGQQR